MHSLLQLGLLSFVEKEIKWGGIRKDRDMGRGESEGKVLNQSSLIFQGDRSRKKVLVFRSGMEWYGRMAWDGE